MITYYKRVINGEVKELHYHHEFDDYTKSKSYPPNEEDVFSMKNFEEMELNEWLDLGLKLGILQTEDLIPNSSSSSSS